MLNIEAVILEPRLRSTGLNEKASPQDAHPFVPVTTDAPHQESNDPGPPPDGGLRAWLQILAGHLVNALTWGFPASFGVYQLYYTETLHLPPSQVSWIGSVQIFLSLSISTFSGRAADAGYARNIVLLGSVLLLVGTFMTSLATEYWQIFLSQGLCTGIGMGLMFMPAVATISTYFSKRKSMALAIAASGSGTGSIVFPAVVQYLQPQIGFPWAVRCSGFIGLAFVIVINILLRPRLPPRRLGPIVEWGAFREPPYVLFAIGTFLLFWALYFCFFYSCTAILVSGIGTVNTFVTTIIGLDNLEAVKLLIVINAAGIPVRPFIGYGTDHWFGAVNTLITCVTFLGFMLYVWIAVKSTAGAYIWAVAYGIATGAAQGIFVGALASLTTDLSKIGTRFGMVCSILAFATLAGPPTAGALIQHDGGRFVYAQIWAGTVTVVGAFFIDAARFYQVKS